MTRFKVQSLFHNDPVGLMHQNRPQCNNKCAEEEDCQQANVDANPFSCANVFRSHVRLDSVAVWCVLFGQNNAIWRYRFGHSENVKAIFKMFWHFIVETINWLMKNNHVFYEREPQLLQAEKSNIEHIMNVGVSFEIKGRGICKWEKKKRRRREGKKTAMAWSRLFVLLSGDV